MEVFIMHTITLVNGDGIGPEISASVMEIIQAAGLKIDWDIQTAGADVIEQEGVPLPKRVLDSIRKNKVALKAPVTTPIGKGFRSVNVQLRKDLDLYANLRPCKNLPGVETRFKDVDLVVVRENTEDLYAGVEEQIDKNTAHSIKIITRKASERICKFAFEYAVKNNRHEVCAVTKANIMKLSDGLFLESFRHVAQDYPNIKTREILVDNLCMQLVQDPTRFDVLVLPNLYGDIVSDLTAGLIGGLGVAQGANIGEDCAVFEPVHGSAPDIKGQNKANPTALLLSAIEMLKYVGERVYADKIEKALFKTLAQGCKTVDIGGNLSTNEFTAAVISNLGK
jgi:isocitrate dehydrogenase (NAD(+))